MATVTYICWNPADQPPDDDCTVLLFHPQLNEPVWLGYRNDGRWLNVDAWEVEGVTHWAHLPVGPTA